MHPIEEEAGWRENVKRLERDRERLKEENWRETAGLDEEYGVLRNKIKDVRERMDERRRRASQEKERCRREFQGRLGGLQGRRYELEKEQYRIIEGNRDEIRRLKAANLEEISRQEIRNTEALVALQRKTQSRNIDFSCEFPGFLEIQERDFDKQPQICQQQQALSLPLTATLSSLLSSNLQLSTLNSKLQHQITRLSFKLQDLLPSIHDLQHQILLSHNPHHQQQLSQKQQQIDVISNEKMKGREFVMMGVVKETVRVGKVIECGREKWKELVEEVEGLEGRWREVEGRIGGVEGEIVEEKGVGRRGGRMGEEARGGVERLKRRRREVERERVETGNGVRREIEGLARALEQNRIFELLKTTTSTSTRHTHHPSTFLPPQSPLKTEPPPPPPSQPSKSRSQLHKITRALHTSSLLTNTLSNIKKIYNNHTLQAYDQNQDLIEHWNTLRWEKEKLRKSLVCGWVIQNRTMEGVKTMPSQREVGEGKGKGKREGNKEGDKEGKKTPFQEYWGRKRAAGGRRMKTCGGKDEI